MLPNRIIPAGRECAHICCGNVCHREIKPHRPRKPIQRYNAKPKEKSPEMDAFWMDCCRIIAARPYCAECGSWIPPNLYWFATAHIFPKAIFTSVADHPLNWLKLNSLCGCHERSHRLDTFSKMNVFRFAVERFRQFEHQITETHSYLDLFKSYASKYEPIQPK